MRPPKFKYGNLPDKIDLQMIRDKIVDTEYIYSGTLTICIIVMQNGYKVIGESACVDPSNYSRALGEQYAYNNAIDKVFALEGYLLSEQRKNYLDLIDSSTYPRTLAPGSCGIIKESKSVNKPYVQPVPPPDNGVKGNWIEPVMDTIHHSDYYYETDRNKPLNPVHDSEHI